MADGLPPAEGAATASREVVCLVSAAQAYGVDRDEAVREFKLRDGRSGEIRRLQDGSYEIGIMRIPSAALPALERYGITGEKLLNDGCLNVQVAVYMMKLRESVSARPAGGAATSGVLRPLPATAAGASGVPAAPQPAQVAPLAADNSAGRRRQCIAYAANYYQLPVQVLQAIVRTEGGTTGTMSRNRNGSVDMGVMQVNSVHLTSPPHNFISRGVTAQQLIYDDCTNIVAGASILRYEINQAGDFWGGVGRYHSKTPYYSQIYLGKVVGHLRAIMSEASRK